MLSVSEIHLLGITTPSPGAGLDLQVSSVQQHHWASQDSLAHSGPLRFTSSLQKPPALQLLASLPTRAPLLTDPLTSHCPTWLLIGNKLKLIFPSQAFCP